MPSTPHPSPVNKTLTIIDHLLIGTVIFITSAMVINVLWQVATRYILNDPSSYTEEIARFLLIWIGLLGGAYAYRSNAHIGLDIITKNLQGLTKTVTELFALVVVFLFSAIVMAYGGSQLVLLTLELQQISASLGIPIGYVYTVIPLSGALICLYSLVSIADCLRSHKEA